MAKNYEQINKYILDAIDSSGYDVVTPSTTEGKLRFLYDTFFSEYHWNIERVGQLKAMTEWLQGLPSSINIEFANYAIIQLAKSWGSLPQDATERQEDKLLANYWQFMAMRILSLFKKYKIA
jgi:hypothetical protein